MRPIEREEVLPIAAYEAIREPFRRRVIEEKRPRRVQVGEHISVVFENRDSVLLQIQEMLRTERITSERGVSHEIETYNDLLPAEGQLSMTLFVEIPDRALRDQMLVDLAGLPEHVALEIDGARLPVRGRRDGEMEGRTTAVHYLKVTLPPAARSAIRAGTAAAALVVDHPRYTARAALGPSTISGLAEDLA